MNTRKVTADRGRKCLNVDLHKLTDSNGARIVVQCSVQES